MDAGGDAEQVFGAHAAIGIAIAILNQVLSKAGREEQAMMVTLAGVILVLAIIINMLTEFFDTVRVFLTF